MGSSNDKIVVPKAQARRVIDAMVKAHPYEESAYDIYELVDRFAGDCPRSLLTAGSVGLDVLTSVRYT